MGKLTPGPWDVATDYDGTLWVRYAEAEASEKDIRLMNAAPELLAELYAINGVISQSGSVTIEAGSVWHKHILEAIAKAETKDE